VADETPDVLLRFTSPAVRDAAAAMTRLRATQRFKEATLRLAVARAPRPDAEHPGSATVVLWAATETEISCVRSMNRSTPKGSIPPGDVFQVIGMARPSSRMAYDNAVQVARVGGSEAKIVAILATLPPHDYAIARCAWKTVAIHSVARFTSIVGVADDVVARQVRACP
jgi:hypothetical protein